MKQFSEISFSSDAPPPYNTWTIIHFDTNMLSAINPQAKINSPNLSHEDHKI